MKYLRSWNESLENNRVQVKIITPKIAEDRQKPFWYNDGDVIANVSDGIHTIYIDKRGSNPSKIDLASKSNDNDISDFNSNFNVEYWQQKPVEFFHIIENSDTTKYDEAIEIAKKSFDDPEILEIIAEHCGCEQCQLWRDSHKFGI